MGLLLAIGIILLILWALGLFLFSWGAIIYIPLVVAVICTVVWLIQYLFHRHTFSQVPWKIDWASPNVSRMVG